MVEAEGICKNCGDFLGNPDSTTGQGGVVVKTYRRVSRGL